MVTTSRFDGSIARFGVMTLAYVTGFSAPLVRSMRASDRAPAIILPGEKICNRRVVARPLGN
jgi:hypothetical protein